MAITFVTDVVVPTIFTPYTQQLTETKSRLIQSGALARDSMLDEHLGGGGKTFNSPSWQDLPDDADVVATGITGQSAATPNDIPTSTEVAVRLSRNQSWGSADLAAALAGEDPMEAIADRVSSYWARRLQSAFLATMVGVFADNDANDSGDYTNDITGSFVDGVTNFSAEAVIDTLVTAGDSAEDLTMVMMHSVVYARAQKNNLIDFVPDSEGRVRIPTFLGREVIVDDGLPVATNDYQTFLFGAGAVRLGMGTPKVGTETDRSPLANNGAGEETLTSRVEWAIHPAGHAYTGTAPDGGPSNAATSNNLGHADSWNRVFPQRKQIKIARLITTEA